MDDRPVRRRPPQQRYFRPPKGCPTAQCFDMDNGLEEQPLQKSRARPVENSWSVPQHDADEGPDYFLNLPMEQYQARIWNELHAIEEAAKQRCSGEALPLPDRRSIQDLDNFLEPEPRFEYPYNRLDNSSYPLIPRVDWTNKRVTFEHNESPDSSELALSRQVTYPTVEEQAASVAVLATTPSDYPEANTQLVKQYATRPISEAQLISEVKGIYAGLVMVEKKCIDIATQQHYSNESPTDISYKGLVALHRSLLQEHHDFFSATQHPTAPQALRQLAIKFAMPKRLWRCAIQNSLELLQDQPSEQIAAFTIILANWLQSLKQHIPSMMNEWRMIEENLVEYIVALRSGGVDVADPFAEPAKLSQIWSSNFRHDLPPPPKDDVGFDEVLRSCFYQHQLANPPFSSDEARQWYTSIALPLKDIVMILMSGWLTYGMKIAKDFHCYCKVFKFMAWAGASF